ncbi:Glia-derived nexin [Thelohanellus kitauei]|uniref:Glia-derived nexin n=1 Tax=Thelohanellus kitauei TaxID=669202 RepID=A0A0C2MII5_THEKT|nr:Glia-derived nexin [Thelohanellus kitauei]
MYTYFETSPSIYSNLKLPKFQILSQIDFVETLKHFGFTDMFDRDKADFGTMTNHSVFIGNLMQIANIAVYELDDSIADTTEVMEDEPSSDSEEFYVTRPFVFCIYSSSTRIVLFSAIVTNPNSN